jgi:hypothetical protein
VRVLCRAEISEVFIRVNRQGMRITSADRAIALMGKLDVRAMAQELRQKVRDEVFALESIDPILIGFNLISERPALDGSLPKLDTMAQRWSKEIERHDNSPSIHQHVGDASGVFLSPLGPAEQVSGY